MLSIVMPSLNQARFIEKSIDSIFTQIMPDEVELIICDGGSTDNTINILKSKSSENKNIRWVSESDNGPASAVNKALHMSKGTFIGWLNSDDLYVEDAFDAALKHFESNPNHVLVYGHGEHIDQYGNHLSPYPTLKPELGLDLYSAFKNGCFICAPSVFFKRSILTLQGYLDESYQAAFDYEYWLRTFGNFKGRIGFIDKVMAQSRIHEDCITHKMRGLVSENGARVTHQYFGKAPIHWLTTYIDEMRAELGDEAFGKTEIETMAFITKISHYFESNKYSTFKASLRNLFESLR